MNDTLLEVRDLEAGYGSRPVLRDIAVEVGRGEIVALLGANGAGKTTFLRAVSGQIKSRGAVTIDGRSAVGRSPEQIVRMGVAHVPQGRGTFSRLTVDENLRLGAAIRRDSSIRAGIDKWYDFFPRLRERRQQAAGTLSGGEQQMLAVARAMMSQPRLLLLDEPSLGLAPNLTQLLFEHLVDINATLGTAMLIVEQNANLALATASRAYVLTSGSVAVSGSSQSLLSDEAVRRAYLRV